MKKPAKKMKASKTAHVAGKNTVLAKGSKSTPIKIKEKRILVKRKIQSQQHGGTDRPLVDLIPGDVVELRSDGIYFTRKINAWAKRKLLKQAFEDIIEQNLLSSQATGNNNEEGLSLDGAYHCQKLESFNPLNINYGFDMEKILSDKRREFENRYRIGENDRVVFQIIYNPSSITSPVEIMFKYLNKTMLKKEESCIKKKQLKNR